MAIYRPPYLPGNLVTYLPYRGDTYNVRYLLESELECVPAIVERAAKAGLNVGLDEYEDEEWCEFVPSGSNILAVRSNQSDQIMAIIYIHMNLYCRSLIPVEGYFEIFLDPKLVQIDAKIYGKLAEFAVRVTKDIHPVHLGVATSIFTVHAEWISELRRQDFELVACVPFAGNTPKSKNVDSYVLRKKYPNSECNVQHLLIEVADFAKTICDDLPHPLQDPDPLRVMKFLPIKVDYHRGNLATRWRDATREDSAIAWNLIQADAANGIGYAEDEFPSFEFFYHYNYKLSYNFIIEEESTREVIGYGQIKEMWPPRQKHNTVCSTMIILSPAYRGKGIYGRSVTVLDYLCIQLGLTGVLADSFLVNLPMQEAQRQHEFLRVGVIPNSAIVRQHGLVDSVLSFKKVPDVTSYDPNKPTSKL